MSHKPIIIKLKIKPRPFEHTQGEDLIWIGNDISINTDDIPQIIKFLKAVEEVQKDD